MYLFFSSSFPVLFSLLPYGVPSCLCFTLCVGLGVFFVWQTLCVPETIKNTSLKVMACSGSHFFNGWPSKLLGILMPEDSRCWVDLTPDATHSLVCYVLLVYRLSEQSSVLLQCKTAHVAKILASVEEKRYGNLPSAMNSNPV